MQEIATQAEPGAEALVAIENLHVQAQAAADAAGRSALEAVEASHKAGKALDEIRATFRRPIEFEAWLKKHATGGDDGLFAWSARYLKIGQMELDFEATAALRQQMTLLELVPVADRGESTFEPAAVNADEKHLLLTGQKLERLFGKVRLDDTKRASYREQFRPLWLWLKDEVFREGA